MILNTFCKHALETIAPQHQNQCCHTLEPSKHVLIKYCQWQANLPTHPMQHRYVLCCNCVVSRVWPHLRSWVTLLGWCICHTSTQCMHNNGSSFALGVETNHTYLSAALPTQALPLPPATPTKTIFACTYFAKNNNKQQLLEILRTSEKL